MIAAALLFFVALIFTGILIEVAIVVTTNSNFSAPGIGPGIAVLIVVLIVSVFMFYVGLTFKRGVEQEDLNKCRIWFIVTAIFYDIGVFLITVSILVIIVLSGVSTGIRFVGLFGFLIGFGLLVYNAFSLWVAHEFMNELKSGGQTFEGSVVYNNTNTGGDGKV